MANFEYDYNNKDYELVASQVVGQLTNDDYVRIIIYDSQLNTIITYGDNNLEAVFYATPNQGEYLINNTPYHGKINEFAVGTAADSAIRRIGYNRLQIQGFGEGSGGPTELNDFKIYKSSNNDFYIKPNELLNKYDIAGGKYKFRVDFLRQIKPISKDPSFYYNPTGTPSDTSIFGLEGPFNTESEFLATLPFPTYLEEFNINQDSTFLFDVSDLQGWITGVGRPDIAEYLFPFLGGDDESSFALPAQYQFIIKEISTSRKEVRLKILNKKIEENSVIKQSLNSQFNSNTTSYKFNYMLNYGTGEDIAITNFAFDAITDGKDDQSIILRLYKPLKFEANKLKQVTIEREVLTTQIIDISYISDIVPEQYGDGLNPDDIENWLSTNQNESFEYEVYNDLTSSISEVSLQNIVSGSTHNYPNLNTDFKLFENHTFFGSAKRKLVNFKNKVETIQGYYSNISASLSASGVNVDNDPENVIKQREDLFNKIDSEINSFTPYERFLYFDGQSESTASAPGAGENYADVNAVSENHLINQLNGKDGFRIVYHHQNRLSSSLKTETDAHTDLFSYKYYLETKPFFNYDSSVYLSFLMKSNYATPLIWSNENPSNSSLRLPYDSMYQNTIISPSGSNYQRFIFEASQSYWVPTANVLNGQPYDISSINDWSTNSKEYEILSGSIKTGSNAIKDTGGNYQYVTTVTTGSGVQFKGSVMPSGELFRIYHENTLHSGSVGYWDVDNQTSGSSATDDMFIDFSGNGNSGSVDAGGPTISDGLEVHGKTYGKSMLFDTSSYLPTAANTDEVLFKSDDYNFSISSSFSLSVWGKRYHPHTASADSHDGRNVQALFTKGTYNDSFGLDYNFENNKIQARYRTGGGTRAAQIEMDDDALNWHHYVMTFESGSDTGLKLYVDGELQSSTNTNPHDWDSTKVGHDFVTSSLANTETNLTIGYGVIGGNGSGWNGYIQYPRIYNRTLSAGEVKNLYLSPDGNFNLKITDVKVTLKDPTDTQPFSELYHTSSGDWVAWYDGMYDSASAFDETNIHSLENNLPLYIQESDEYDDLKDFLALQGEQYDIIKNHIDSFATLNDRGYKKTDSPPKNTYPMLLKNIGWEAINPFSGSLTDTLGTYLNSVTSIDDIKNNTWRKTLNNLLYVYKSKGTENSVRALLNIYGYPPDVLDMQEFGGSTSNPLELIIGDAPPLYSKTPSIDLDGRHQTGSIGFVSNKQKLYNYNFKNNSDRKLGIDWGINNANIESIEFVYKHQTTKNTQEILKLSGSGGEHLWDLRLVPSTDGVSSSFEFRLNNTHSGSSAIADNAVSMSTTYSTMIDGQKWNVMLQRMSSSISGSGTNEYRLHSSLQDDISITTYNYVTMSVSGGLTADSNYYANQNWNTTGSRHYLSSSNLTVGEIVSGSLSEIKAWSTPLSISRFRQHTLNKFSTVGNTINSHKDELIYHFKLNENYTTSSISSSAQTPYIIDSAPKTTLVTDYSFSIPLSTITGSSLYGFDIIDSVKFGLQDNNQNNANDNNIIINPSNRVIGNLNPTHTIINKQDKPNFVVSNKLELNSSPQNTINNLILNSMDTSNFELYYGNPQYQYTSSYTEFDILKNEFFDAHPILVDTNKFIRAHENIFNQSITDGLKTLVPARSTLSDRNTNVGVTIKPTLLEKQKIEYKKHSVETNPNSPSGSLSMVNTGSYQHNFIFSSTLELPKSGSISMGNAYSSSLDYVNPLFLQPNHYTASLELPKSASIFVTLKNTGSLELPYSSSISMGNSYVTESFHNRNIVPQFIHSNGFTASIEFPKSGSIEEITTNYTKKYVNVHDSWGIGTNDTHFMNYGVGNSEVTSSQTSASLHLTFIQSASFESSIILSSFDGDNLYRTRKYLCTTGSTNGAFSADSSSVHFLTGSGTTLGAGSASQAQNLLAAITSSNGHGSARGTLFKVIEDVSAPEKVVLRLKALGPQGNTFSASFADDFQDSIGESVSSLPFTGGSTIPGKFNIGHIETKNVFHMIGDTEYYSSSYGKSDDFTNFSYFFNREQVVYDVAGVIKYGEKPVNYDSYIPTLAAAGKTTPSPAVGSLTLEGRMMGKTKYFFTSSTGDVVLPANHVSRYVDHYLNNMRNGTQNIGPGILPVKQEDYATASFYRVKVTGGEEQAYVGSKNLPTIGKDDKIMR